MYLKGDIGIFALAFFAVIFSVSLLKRAFFVTREVPVGFSNWSDTGPHIVVERFWLDEQRWIPVLEHVR